VSLGLLHKPRKKIGGDSDLVQIKYTPCACRSSGTALLPLHKTRTSLLLLSLIFSSILPSVMSTSTRDVIYRFFVFQHILPTVLFSFPAIIGPANLPGWVNQPKEWYLTTYNDPLGVRSFPGGWFGGLTACEVFLQLPYFIWSLTVPIGSALVYIN
jgi:hypothetical protein